MRLKRYLLPRLAILLTVCLLLSGVALRRHQIAATSATRLDSAPTIIIDPGHGGFDGGAVVGEILEKDINLQIANRLAAMLTAAGFQVISTRTDDSSTEVDPTATISARKKSDLAERLRLAKSHPEAIYISIHLNKYPSASCKGAQMFYAPRVPQAKQLADCLRAGVVDLLQPENHRTVKAGTRDTYLLYYAPIPAVIAECGFMSNPAELEQLTTPAYQGEMAFALFCGIISYYMNTRT